MSTQSSAESQNERSLVKYSVYSTDADVSGMTIGQVIEENRAQWNLGDETPVAKINKELVDYDHVIEPGETVNLSKATGEKGKGVTP